MDNNTTTTQDDSQIGEASLTLLGQTVTTPIVKRYRTQTTLLRWTKKMHNQLKKLFYEGWDDEKLAKHFGCTKAAITNQRFVLKFSIKEQKKKLIRKKNKDIMMVLGTPPTPKKNTPPTPKKNKQIPLMINDNIFMVDESIDITVKKTSKSQIKMMAAFYCNPSVKQSILDRAIPLNQYVVDLILRQSKEVYIVTDEKNNFVVVNSKKEAAEYYQTFTDHRQIYQAFPMRQEDFCKNISASVSSDIAIKLEKLAEESGKSISYILNEALKNL